MTCSPPECPPRRHGWRRAGGLLGVLGACGICCPPLLAGAVTLIAGACGVSGSVLGVATGAWMAISAAVVTAVVAGVPARVGRLRGARPEPQAAARRGCR